MKRFLSFILVLIILLVPLASFAKSKAISDDECVSKVLLEYADSLGKISYKEMKKYLTSLGYKYKTQIGRNKTAQFDITCELGSLYIGFYPLGSNDADYGKPDKEMLCCLEYSRGDCWISVSNSYHLKGAILNTGDKSRDPVNQEVSTLEQLVDFYNNKIGGSVSLESGTDVTTDSDRRILVENTIKARIEEYTNTTIQNVEVNSNVGTSDPDDFIVLIYFSWGTMNSVEMTRTMLEMFSDDMAVTLATKYEHASQITLFWEVPYLLESGTCAKYSYEVRKGGAYRTEKFGPLYR